MSDPNGVDISTIHCCTQIFGDDVQTPPPGGNKLFPVSASSLEGPASLTVRNDWLWPTASMLKVRFLAG
jgi:hypothetical protein